MEDLTGRANLKCTIISHLLSFLKFELRVSASVTHINVSLCSSSNFVLFFFLASRTSATHTARELCAFHFLRLIYTLPSLTRILLLSCHACSSLAASSPREGRSKRTAYSREKSFLGIFLRFFALALASRDQTRNRQRDETHTKQRTVAIVLQPHQMKICRIHRT